MFPTKYARLLSFCPVDVVPLVVVGGFQGGHGKANVILRAVPLLCRTPPPPPWWYNPPPPPHVFFFCGGRVASVGFKPASLLMPAGQPLTQLPLGSTDITCWVRTGCI